MKAMIAYIKGKIIAKKEDCVVVEQQGLGYQIFVSKKALKSIETGKETEFFTYFVIRNEKPELYGFLSPEELEVFEILEKISGIGPKGALAIASLGAIEELRKAVESQDFKYFQNIKGIGRKKIQKIILEMSGSLRRLAQENFSVKKDKDTLKGLMALGFSATEAKQAIEQVPEEIKEPSQRIQKALQLLGKNG